MTVLLVAGVFPGGVKLARTPPASQLPTHPHQLPPASQQAFQKSPALHHEWVPTASRQQGSQGFATSRHSGWAPSASQQSAPMGAQRSDEVQSRMASPMHQDYVGGHRLAGTPPGQLPQQLHAGQYLDDHEVLASEAGGERITSDKS